MSQRFNVEMTAGDSLSQPSFAREQVPTPTSAEFGGSGEHSTGFATFSAAAFALGAVGAVGASHAFSRRQALLTAAVAALSPKPANASYALYAASQDDYNTRRAEKWVPVATSDVKTLAAIQDELDQKRPQRKKIAATRKDVYCAGVTSSVSPLIENRCRPENTGVSKADQTTGRTIGEWELGAGQFVQQGRYFDRTSQ
jgi:hypothetical protein